jgi:hypothetical protein
MNASYVLVVPCCNERIETVMRLLKSAAPDTIVLLVVNRRLDMDPGPNDDFMHAFRDCRRELHRDGVFATIIDRNTPAQALTGGAGEARNIGGRIALTLHKMNAIETRWVHFTDADTVLPTDFFSAAEAAWTSTSALAIRSFDMVTAPGDEAQEAVLSAKLWNLGMLLALVGRTKARSPWPVNFSTVSIDAGLLSRHDGYPPFAVGEDFMAICAFGKQGRIHRVAGDPVRIDARAESKGPSGTGKTVAGDREKILAGVPIVCTDPAVWAHLRAIYDVSERVLMQGEEEREAIAHVCDAPGLFGALINPVTLRFSILCTIGSVRDSAYGLGWTAEHSAKWFHERAFDFLATDKVTKELKKMIPEVPVDRALELYGWGSSADIDAAIANGRRDEAAMCFRDYGVTT